MKNYYLNLFIISLSPWPIFFSISLFTIFLNIIIFFWSNYNIRLILNFILLFLVSFCWWNDVIIESTIIGNHNIYIIIITINRIIIFIISEIFFFISFFWTFFHSIFSPDIIIGSNWPSKGIISINYLNLPLINSIFLIGRGCFVTFSHYELINNIINNSKNGLVLTIILGVLFLICQLYEYIYSLFSFSDRVFGSIFFIATGFHGIHVLIGTLFLLMIFLRMNTIHFSKDHLIGYEFSIWYWHFVDVVWLYLYIVIYWLGS